MLERKTRDRDMTDPEVRRREIRETLDLEQQVEINDAK